MRRLILLIGLAIPFDALGQDTSRDRAELDIAAGRALFQPTPLYDSIASPGLGPSRDGVAPAPAAVAPGPSRRTIRVVYPGPPGR